MNIYEMHGRQSEKMQEVVESWGATLQLLRDLRDGNILPAQLVVEQDGWKLSDRRNEDRSCAGCTDSGCAEECSGSENSTDQAHQDWTA